MATTKKSTTAKTASKTASKATTKATAKATTKKSAQFFKGLETIDEIRIQFLDSLEGLTGDTAKEMFTEYLKVAKKFGDKHKKADGKVYTAKTRLEPKEWAKMVLALNEVEGLHLSFQSPSQDFKGRWLWASGETKKNRDILKSYGFSWCPQQGSLWVLKSA